MESADPELAARLQNEDNRAAMMGTDSGKAVLLVESIVALVRSTNDAYPDFKEYRIDTVSYDDMVWSAEQLIRLRRDFAAKKRPTRVDVGYHYTNESNLPRIRTHGLLTKGDREAKDVAAATYHGSRFGDGWVTRVVHLSCLQLCLVVLL